MKVLEVYDKNSDIRCYYKNVFKVMRNFLSNYPSEYGECYYKNLDTLELIKVDKFADNIVSGKYNNEGNAILFSKNNALGHELFHVASCDRERGLLAIAGPSDIEQGFIEGMTEYLFMDAYGLSSADEYSFEVFSVMMLDDIPNLFKPYFIPNHNEFINLFPNKKDIYSLMYAINVYHDEAIDYISSLNNDGIHNALLIIQEAIRSVIDNLITIELSIEKNNCNLIAYGDKFMDLISSNDIKEIMYWLYPKYGNYANRQINTKIKCKR